MLSSWLLMHHIWMCTFLNSHWRHWIFKANAHPVVYGWRFSYLVPALNLWAAIAWWRRHFMEWQRRLRQPSRILSCPPIDEGFDHILNVSNMDTMVSKQKHPAQLLAAGSTCQRNRRCILVALSGAPQDKNHSYYPGIILMGELKHCAGSPAQLVESFGIWIPPWELTSGTQCIRWNQASARECACMCARR